MLCGVRMPLVHAAVRDRPSPPLWEICGTKEGRNDDALEIIWRPLPDSNWCCRRERAVSWASRRRGRVGAVPGLDTGWGARIQGEGRMPRGAAPHCTGGLIRGN